MRVRNVYFDAIGLARAGKSLFAEEILKKAYPQISSEEIIEAIKVGRKVNEVLWNIANKLRDGEISEQEFENIIIESCPKLEQDMVGHLIANAIFDTR